MHTIRVYVDTSVFGGTEDEEFAEITRRFFQQVRAGLFSRIRGFNVVNLRNGYRTMTILSPQEVIDVDEEQDL